MRDDMIDVFNSRYSKIECSDCEKIIQSWDVFDHAEVCRDTMVQCHNVSFGCKRIMKRREIPDHMKKCKVRSIF